MRQSDVEIVMHRSVLTGFAEDAAANEVGHYVVLLIIAGRLIFDHPAIEQRIEIELLAGLAISFTPEGDRAIGFDGNRAESVFVGVPGVNGADGIAQFLRVDGGKSPDSVKRS